MMMKLIQTMFIFGLLMTGAAHAYGDCTRHEKLHVVSDPNDIELYGFADEAGHVRIKPQYHFAHDFTDFGFGYADGYWIGPNGEKLLQAYTFNGDPDDPAEYEGLMRYVGDGDKIGFVDECLAVAIPARFDYASRFDGGIALACTGCDINTRDEDPEFESWAHKKWGIVDRTGKLIVPMQYTFLQAFDQANKITEAAAKGQTPH